MMDAEQTLKDIEEALESTVTTIGGAIAAQAVREHLDNLLDWFSIGGLVPKGRLSCEPQDG